MRLAAFSCKAHQLAGHHMQQIQSKPPSFTTSLSTAVYFTLLATSQFILFKAMWIFLSLVSLVFFHANIDISSYIFHGPLYILKYIFIIDFAFKTKVQTKFMFYTTLRLAIIAPVIAEIFLWLNVPFHFLGYTNDTTVKLLLEDHTFFEEAWFTVQYIPIFAFEVAVMRSMAIIINNLYIIPKITHVTRKIHSWFVGRLSS